MRKNSKIVYGLILALLALSPLHGADSAPSSLLDIAGSKETLFTFQNQLRLIGFLAIISLIPFGVMMMTSFTRISIVFQFLKHALGTTQAPSNQIIVGLSLILTGFVMHPVLHTANQEALTPYLNGSFNALPEVREGKASAETLFFEKTWTPLRKFLLKHTREKDLELFMDIAHATNPEGNPTPKDLDAVPWYCIVPAFMTSELRIAFMMGFLLFLPFLIIDMVVSAVLMSLGMMMLPPIMISTPFKLLLFILMDGWRLIIQQLVTGFNPG